MILSIEINARGALFLNILGPVCNGSSGFSQTPNLESQALKCVSWTLKKSNNNLVGPPGLSKIVKEITFELIS